MPALAAPLDRSTLTTPPVGPMTSDVALVRRCRRGEERAFELIYERHHAALYRYCRSFMGSHEDAEEALQTTMMKAYRALRTAERDVTLRPWLFRIAHNECVRALQGRRRHAELSGDEEAVGEGSPERAEVRADLEQLRRDLAALPTEQRSALLLREMCGLSHREIGDSLGAAPEAVKQLIYEARQALHEFGEGRALACTEVRARVSEGDGRVLRGRRMRAHLRTCAGCQAFRERLVARPVQLAALFPAMPAAAARWVLQTVLGGSGAGGATVMVSAGLGGAGLKAVVAAALALVAGSATLPSAHSGTQRSAVGGAPAAASASSLVPAARTAAGAAAVSGPVAGSSAPQPVSVASPQTEAERSAGPGRTGSGAPAAAGANDAAGGGTGAAGPQAAPGPSAQASGAASGSQPSKNVDLVQDPAGSSGSGAGATGTPPASPVGPTSTTAAPTTPALPAVPTLPAGVAPTLPTVTVPSVTTPAVTTPPVTTPAVTTPAVTVPGVVTLPSVTVPAVIVPPLTVPQVTTPPVTTPQLPQLPALPGLP